MSLAASTPSKQIVTYSLDPPVSPDLRVLVCSVTSVQEKSLIFSLLSFFPVVKMRVTTSKIFICGSIYKTPSWSKLWQCFPYTFSPAENESSFWSLKKRLILSIICPCGMNKTRYSLLLSYMGMLEILSMHRSRPNLSLYYKIKVIIR